MDENMRTHEERKDRLRVQKIAAQLQQSNAEQKANSGLGAPQLPQPTQKTPLSNLRLKIAILILDEAKDNKLGKTIVREICRVDPWVKAKLALYNPAYAKPLTNPLNTEQEA